jgi:hypothetical protein
MVRLEPIRSRGAPDDERALFNRSTAVSWNRPESIIERHSSRSPVARTVPPQARRAARRVWLERLRSQRIGVGTSPAHQEVSPPISGGVE